MFPLSKGWKHGNTREIARYSIVFLCRVSMHSETELNFLSKFNASTGLALHRANDTTAA
jgi:hypothetical protein